MRKDCVKAQRIDSGILLKHLHITFILYSLVNLRYFKKTNIKNITMTFLSEKKLINLNFSAFSCVKYVEQRRKKT